MYLGDNVFKQIQHYKNLRSIIDKYKFTDDIIDYYERTDKYNKCNMYWTEVRHQLDFYFVG